MSSSCRYKELLNEISSEFDRQIAENTSLAQENAKLKKEHAFGSNFEPISAHSVSASTLEGNHRNHQVESSSDTVLDPENSMRSRRASLNLKDLSSALAPSAWKHETTTSAMVVMEPQKIVTRSWTQEPAAATSERRHSTLSGDKNHTVQFKIQKAWYLINPEQSKFMSRWDMVTLFALCWVALVTPVQVGLMESKMSVFFVLSLCVDSVFLFDMCLQFFVIYPVKKARGVEMEHRHSKIVIHYFKTWFVLDFVTIIPFDLLSIVLEVDGLQSMKTIKIIRLLRLLKLMRIFKTSRVFHRIEIALAFPYQRFALARFLVILLLVCHWQGCIWAMTLTFSADGVPRWIDSLVEAETANNITPLSSDSGIKLYITSFYFCSYTMTSVGYGDIGPQNLVERVVCTLIILLSGLCWAYILGEVCGIVGDMNKDAQNFRRKMDDLNHMMAERGIPDLMRRRLRSFFLSNKESLQYHTQKQLLREMSPALQGEVAMALNSVWISKVSFLKSFIELAEQAGLTSVGRGNQYRACVADIARSLDTSAYAQGEQFGSVQVLHILYRGLVGFDSKIHKTGSVWGEDFVLSDLRLISIKRAVSFTYVEVIQMGRDTFMEIVENHRTSCPELAKRVREFRCRLAVQRGILAEAKRRIERREAAMMQMLSAKGAESSFKLAAEQDSMTVEELPGHVEF
eukprot:TRINITY_DN26394_c0_g1_i1.p1 TRINITY_DN26394_c0_g1~~TRINITY_DN26394_c0_g1_i1.p1  ORF type:complete len:726 (+),score=111.81 TRINITY_DN26394_c0_g1_i1:125-2179(+)